MAFNLDDFRKNVQRITNDLSDLTSDLKALKGSPADVLKALAVLLEKQHAALAKLNELQASLIKEQIPTMDIPVIQEIVSRLTTQNDELVADITNRQAQEQKTLINENLAQIRINIDNEQKKAAKTPEQQKIAGENRKLNIQNIIRVSKFLTNSRIPRDSSEYLSLAQQLDSLFEKMGVTLENKIASTVTQPQPPTPPPRVAKPVVPPASAKPAPPPAGAKPQATAPANAKPRIPTNTGTPPQTVLPPKSEPNKDMSDLAERLLSLAYGSEPPLDPSQTAPPPVPPPRADAPPPVPPRRNVPPATTQRATTPSPSSSNPPSPPTETAKAPEQAKQPTTPGSTVKELVTSALAAATFDNTEISQFGEPIRKIIIPFKGDDATKEALKTFLIENKTGFQVKEENLVVFNPSKELLDKLKTDAGVHVEKDAGVHVDTTSIPQKGSSRNAQPESVSELPVKRSFGDQKKELKTLEEQLKNKINEKLIGLSYGKAPETDTKLAGETCYYLEFNTPNDARAYSNTLMQYGVQHKVLSDPQYIRIAKGTEMNVSVKSPFNRLKDKLGLITHEQTVTSASTPPEASSQEGSDIAKLSSEIAKLNQHIRNVTAGNGQVFVELTENGSKESVKALLLNTTMGVGGISHGEGNSLVVNTTDPKKFIECLKTAAESRPKSLTPGVQAAAKLAEEQQQKAAKAAAAKAPKQPEASKETSKETSKEKGWRSRFGLGGKNK